MKKRKPNLLKLNKKSVSKLSANAIGGYPNAETLFQGNCGSYITVAHTCQSDLNYC
ncbi:hypothetical protein KORDIASMS9_02786 [Kordia sp. SMS9]|uniref:hypothetical protein n=1 Tax=Kordia sp. SMS9 TaxID=2282170 RepID=UPI000E10822D|nr:hypothetical protein [Kordia sp. SMS9]AXG70546.1 hypothetical protein KORDIASMS9_02786 [Kordia sp. SMS9]